MSSVMQNLWDLSVDTQATVREISSELEDKYRQRLLDLGLVPEQKVMCVRQTPFGGPKVYQIGQSLFSFDREVCQSIFITPLKKEPTSGK